jgi:hypothetical protein
MKLNLDINSYNITQLETIFKLKKPYKDFDIINSKLNLLNSIINSQKITNEKREQLNIFLDNVVNKLNNNLKIIDNDNFNLIEQFDNGHYILKNENTSKSTLDNKQKIDKAIIKKTFNVDSIFRRNYGQIDNLSNNFIIDLPETISKAVTMSISSIDIPLSYHNISPEYNNNFFIIEKQSTTDDADVTYYGIKLDQGLYSANNQNSGNKKIAYSIKDAINFSIQNAILLSDYENYEILNNGNINTDLSGIISYEIDQRSGFSSFKLDDSSHNYIYTVIFNVNNNYICKDYPALLRENNVYQKLGWMLGYRHTEMELKTTTNNQKTNLSSGICHINYPRYLYICIDDFQSSSKNYFSIASESVVAPNIVSRINILSLLEDKTSFRSSAAPMDYKHDQKHIREYFGPTDIKKLKITLIDEYGRTFSLNNMDWSFLLTFECFYN